MRYLIGAVFGAILVVVLAKVPWYAVFRDQPPTPVDWAPRFRNWKNGIEQKEGQ